MPVVLDLNSFKNGNQQEEAMVLTMRTSLFVPQ